MLLMQVPRRAKLQVKITEIWLLGPYQRQAIRRSRSIRFLSTSVYSLAPTGIIHVDNNSTMLPPQHFVRRDRDSLSQRPSPASTSHRPPLQSRTLPPSMFRPIRSLHRTRIEGRPRETPEGEFHGAMIQVTTSILIVDTGKKRILVDAGCDEKLRRTIDAFPSLKANLAPAGTRLVPNGSRERE